MTDLVKITTDVVESLEAGLATQSTILDAMEVVRLLGDTHRALKARVEAAAIRHIEAHGPFTSGTTRYYVGANKTTRCLDVRKTVEAVLTAAGGDVDAFVECLSAGAFKPKRTCALLGEGADVLFETRETKDLKTGEVGAKRLQAVDERFV